MTDSLAQNYNAVGAAVMEMIYAPDFLSVGGGVSTKTLAALGQVASTSVLDVGSGLGGAAFYLAEHAGCSVTGIDLLPANVAEATRRASERGLSAHVNFTCANATALPYKDASFDVVWGQDAWCHVNDKATLIAEASRVLRVGGKIVFSDWLTGNPPDASNEDVRRVTASPHMGNADLYRTLLAEQGFDGIQYVDGHDDFVRRYHTVLKQLQALEDRMCAEFGRKVFDIVCEKHAMICRGFESRSLVFGSFVARLS